MCFGYISSYCQSTQTKLKGVNIQLRSVLRDLILNNELICNTNTKFYIYILFTVYYYVSQ
jgi:hypothetical protein